MPLPVHRGSHLRVVSFAVFFVTAGLAIALAMHFDQPIFRLVHNPHGVDASLYAAARQMGEFTTWLFAAPLVMAVHWFWSRRQSLLFSFERSLIVMWAPMFSGVMSTVIKLIVRRERPTGNAGEYVFRAWNDLTWDTSHLGFPSGHAAVAFGGAAMLAFLYPRLSPVWFMAAALCALSRLLTQAHFLSDVVASAVLGYATAWIVWRMYRRWCDEQEPVLARVWRRVRDRNIPEVPAATTPSETA